MMAGRRKAEEPQTTGDVRPATTVASGELAEYEISGPGGSYTALLDQADAERLGAKAVSAPANKAAKPADK